MRSAASTQTDPMTAPFASVAVRMCIQRECSFPCDATAAWRALCCALRVRLVTVGDEPEGVDTRIRPEDDPRDKPWLYGAWLLMVVSMGLAIGFIVGTARGDTPSVL